MTAAKNTDAKRVLQRREYMLGMAAYERIVIMGKNDQRMACKKREISPFFCSCLISIVFDDQIIGEMFTMRPLSNSNV